MRFGTNESNGSGVALPPGGLAGRYTRESCTNDNETRTTHFPASMRLMARVGQDLIASSISAR